jgi:uncharacterized membrane protein YeaQ/YmgE (transglycosylase-associated protein family)
MPTLAGNSWYVTSEWAHHRQLVYGQRAGILGRAVPTKELINTRKEIMNIIWIILIGFVVGVLAKMLTPGRDPSGFFITAVIGIAGSLLATFGGQALGLYRAGEPAGFIGSLVGAIILLAIYHLVRRNSPTVT